MMSAPKNIDTPWVEAGELSGKVYADMVSEMLDQNDIPYYMKADFMTTAFSISSSGMLGGKVKLFVPKAFKEKAELLLHTVSG